MSEAEAGERKAPPRRPSTAAVAVALGLVIALLGLGIGWLWHLVTPRAQIVRVDGGFLYAQQDPEQLIAADGWFVWLGLATGLVLAVFAWVVLRRHRGWPVLVALAAGSLAAGWLAWWLGMRLEETYLATLQATAKLGEQVGAPAALRITDLTADAYWPPKLTGVVAVQALAAVAVYTVLAGFAAHPDLHPDGAKALDVIEDPGPAQPVRGSTPPAVRPQESDVPAAAEPGTAPGGPDVTISSAPGVASDPTDSPERPRPW